MDHAPRNMTCRSRRKVPATSKTLISRHPPTAETMDFNGLLSAFRTLSRRPEDLEAVVAVAGKKINNLAMFTANQSRRLTSHQPKERPNPDKVEPLAERDLTLEKRKFDNETSSGHKKPPWKPKKQAQQSGKPIPRCYRYAAHSYSPGQERRISPDWSPRKEGERGRSRTVWPATATFKILERHESEESRHAEQPGVTGSSSSNQNAAALRVKRTGTSLEARKQQKPESSSLFNTPLQGLSTNIRFPDWGA